MSIPNLSGVPAAIDSTVTAAANAYNTSKTEANRLAYVLAQDYQYSLNVSAAAADVLSLSDQLEAGRRVLARLIELGQQTNLGKCIGGATVDAANAATLAELQWLGTREANIAASVDSQVAAVVAAMP